MTMAVDNQQRHLGSINFDHLPYASGPQFSNPWDTTATSSSPQHLFPSGLNPIARQQSTTTSLPYTTIPVSAPSIAANNNLPLLPYGQEDSLRASQELPYVSRLYGNDQPYSTAPSTSYAPTSAPYATAGYNQRASYGISPPSQPQLAQQQISNDRRQSHTSQSTASFLSSSADLQRERQNSLMDFSRGIAQTQQSRDGYGDALDASRGMLAMSQDVTPRNIYAPRSSRGGSSESYGFPPTHSPSSSISSASYNPSYYGSATSSITDYSESESLEPMSSRTLPPPSGLAGSNVPNAQSMMGQFNSKVASSTQKKHRCKICDKRFTRPSSLQTHMYSHTGEKPYQCEVDGCGRHFSVVSNLRRHRKVHKGERDSISPEE